jgi:hypothetical protein
MTKLFSLALAALVATSSMASAQAAAEPSAAMSQGMIFTDSADSGDNSMRLMFNRIDASAAGVIEIYHYRNREVGPLLATEEVDAGTNWRVNIPIGPTRQDPVIAQLKIDGVVVDQTVIGENS